MLSVVSMTQSARRTLVKFLIAIATLGLGVLFAMQPTQLVNAQVPRCTANNGVQVDCNNVCLLLGNCPTNLNNATNTDNTASRNTIVAIVNIVANALIGLVVIVSVFFIIYAGWMILSGGSEGIKEGQKILINAFIGLAVAILSFLIVQYLVGFLDTVFRAG